MHKRIALKRILKFPLNAWLNPICHLLALLGAHPVLHVSRIRVKTTPTCFGLMTIIRELIIRAC
jgi:hypothetical protein